MSVLAKFRSAKALRKISFNQMVELKVVAEDIDSQPNKVRFQIMFEYFENIKTEFAKQHQSVVGLGANLDDIDLDVEEAVRAQFDFNATYVASTHRINFEKDLTFSPAANSTMSGGLIRHKSRVAPIEIPKFSGDIKTFRSFIELFTELIDNNTSYSEIEKFSHLISLLEGPPLEYLSVFPVTSTNYLPAFQTLREKYDNRKLVALSLLDALDAAPFLNSNNKNAKTLHAILDTFEKNVLALANMGFPTVEWDFVLFHHMNKHLDEELIALFSINCNLPNTEIPTYLQLRKFLAQQTNALDTAEYSRKPKARNVVPVVTPMRPPKRNQACSLLSTNLNNNQNTTRISFCLFCKCEHMIYQCQGFLAKTITERFNFVKENSLCVNCMGKSHNVKNCPSTGVCRHCRQKHHSLLHFQTRADNPSQNHPSNSSNFRRNSANHNQISNSSNNNASASTSNSNVGPASSQFCGLVESKIENKISSTVLLATATVQISNGFGQSTKARALLDCGSQISYISQGCFNQLGLKRYKTSVNICGLNDMNTSSSLGSTNFTITSCSGNHSFRIETIILQKLCPIMPTIYLPNKSSISYLSNISLADEHFNEPHSIDLILGADVYPNIMLDGRIQGNLHEPSAINTIFGWVLIGKISSTLTTDSVTSLLSFAGSENLSIDQTLKQFWEIEEMPSTKSLSPAEESSERIFKSSFLRTTSGRFQVDLPFKADPPHFNFDDARKMASRRFSQLEGRLSKFPELKLIYDEIILDYLKQNYLEEVPAHEIFRNSYYIPHHCVERFGKYRIVFDASAKVLNGDSLNDSLLIGEKLQKDIASVLINFRLHNFVFTCDIKAMFPQILVNPKHRDFMRILYRFSKLEPIKDYRWTRVTFGLSCSPFLANRVILQLAQDEKINYPLAAKALEENIYVDDLCCGAASVSEVLNLRDELIHILQSAGLELRKWSSNVSIILKDLPHDHIQCDPLKFDAQSSILKILGLCWHPSEDAFIFKIESNDKTCTKRNILSDIARIYDPLGFLTPTIIFIKQILQSLWVAGIDWDEQPPESLCKKWFSVKTELINLEAIKIPRPVFQKGDATIQLHGFADASIKAYAAVVYLRVATFDSVSIYLIMSKSKIAPLKPMSIPRLELCAAVLLSELLDYVKGVLEKTISLSKIVAWSDSAVALCWLRSLPYRFTSFIANRISKIQDHVPASSWRHIKSSDNPADCASRGLLPLELVNHPQWWTGPEWLSNSEEFWPQSKVQLNSIEAANLEERNVALTAFPFEENFVFSLLNKFSSLLKIQRIIAYLLRFINNCRVKNEKQFNSFSQIHMDGALLIIIKFIQASYFADEITNMKINKPPSKYLRKLNAFLDDKNILRVGGRLSKSNLNYEIKHPIILPRVSRFTTLLIEFYHKTYLHPGLQQLHYLLLQKFWILSPRRAIKSVISQCKNCWRLNPSNFVPKMADLPKLRVSDAKPFSSIAIDFCGYFMIKPMKGRNTRGVKTYICVFICLATKAIHLEVVSDLSSEAFLGAFRRFVARRGRCSTIISDNGTNFVGASKFILKHCKDVAETENIDWKFNPPSAPHFAGLVEAGVKSCKTHLRRVVGEQVLTLEEFQTLLAQIEAILNSRPLCPVSSDPNDLNVLTPGHFLTLEPLVALPDPDLTQLPLNRLDRWQLLQRLQQDFWSRWKTEYLHTLQQRGKWLENKTEPPSEGDLVLIKTDNVPVLRWPLGRISKLYQGADNISRVALVHTKQGSFKRPLTKLCPLPKQ